MDEESLRWAPILSDSLNVAATLGSGQCFRWRAQPEGQWAGPVGGLVVRVRPQAEGFRWQTLPEPDRWDVVSRYFALDVPLDALYREWTAREPRIAPSVARNAGLRVLRQDAEEVFFSFLCATCNTMTKIARSVNALAARYGEPIATVGGETFYRFPTVEDIAGASEEFLRSALWGYRAPVLIEAARRVAARGPGWLDSLRALPYRDAHAEMAALPGVGAKLADCICLFGLAHDEAVPVDTHVRKAAVRLFRPDLAGRSLTPAVYNALADAFRGRFGPYAGWAQQYLFYDIVNGVDG